MKITVITKIKTKRKVVVLVQTCEMAWLGIDKWDSQKNVPIFEKL